MHRRPGSGLALGASAAEVHLVFTARDIARQLVSDWQEHIKHKHVVTLERFVDDLVELGIDAPRPFGQMFWGLHDPARVLGRGESSSRRLGSTSSRCRNPARPRTRCGVASPR